MMSEIKQRIEQVHRGEVPVGYKRTGAGIVPNDWKEYRLGDIYTERNEPGRDDLPILMVSIHSGVSDGEVDERDMPKTVKRIEDKSEYKCAHTDDLVFNMMRAWQGAIGTVRTDGMVSPAYIVAKPNEKVDPLFMDDYMKSSRMVYSIFRQSYGLTDFRLRLYWDSFTPIECAVPPMSEQRKIVEIVSACNKVIELKQELVDELKKLKKVCLEKMFPQKGSSVPEIRFSGFTAPWEQRKISDVATRYDNLRIPVAASLRIPGTTPYYGANGIQDYVTGFTHEGEFVLVAEDGANDLKNYPVKCVNGRIWVNNHAHVLQSKPEMANNKFLAYSISQADIEALLVGGGRAKLNAEVMMGIDLCLPSVKEQVAIGSYLTQLDNLITLHQRELEAEQQKKKALMKLLLTGIVRTNP